MRIESSVTSISWIPSEAVQGAMKLPFEMGMAHYDQPPPEQLGNLESLRQADRFRFANELTGWIEVEDGKIVGSGQGGQGHIGSTTLRLAGMSATFEAVALSDIRPEPEVTETSVTFRQTAGGRTGAPAPRRVFRPPFIKISAPLAWTTLELTLHADGTSEHRLAGASPFPRHWVYDHDRGLAEKSGEIKFRKWFRRAFGKHSPWGGEDSEALVAEVETALERELSNSIMRGGEEPDIRKVKQGSTLVEQGTPGDELFLLLDGVLRVEVDGKALADLGPGAVLGERAVLEGGNRTSTLTAVTDCKVAVARADQIDRSKLEELSEGHRREEETA